MPTETRPNLGAPVRSLEELAALGAEKKCVFVPNARCFKRHMPAVFAMNLCGQVLLNLFREGMFVYVPAPGKARR